MAAIVKCPMCGETKRARGSDFFRHCGHQYTISEHKVAETAGVSGHKQEQEQSNQLTGLTKQDLVGSNGSKQSNKQQQQDYDYECGDCGKGFNGQPKKCPSCGIKLGWS